MGNSLLKKIHQSFIRPGTIWWLPVNYLLDFPPTFLVFDKKNKEFFKDQKNDYWFNLEDLSYKSELGPQQVINNAEVRPFLVIQKPDMLTMMEEFSVPLWYRNAVTGFPISSISNLEEIERDAGKNKIDLNRLRNKNDYEFIHYLPNDESTRLNNESYVALAAITVLNIEYFTDKRGSVDDNNYFIIKEKIKKYFD